MQLKQELIVLGVISKKGNNMGYKYFTYYINCGKPGLIRIQERKQPSEKNKKGIWIVEEFYKGKFQMPCFPEITWETLRKFIYCGEQKVTK